MPLSEPVCASCGQALPDIESIQQKLNELHRAHPATEMSEAAFYLMTRQLHIAVHGDTWARAVEAPERVWLDLLAAGWPRWRGIRHPKASGHRPSYGNA